MNNTSFLCVLRFPFLPRLSFEARKNCKGGGGDLETFLEFKIIKITMDLADRLLEH